MQGPADYDATAYEWRPTFLPLMRTRVARREAFEKDHRRLGMLRHAALVAELDAPRNAMRALEDAERTRAYADAVEATFSMRVRRGGDLLESPENAPSSETPPNERWFSPASARASRRSPRRSRGSLPSSPPSATGSRTARLAAASARTRICFLPTPASRSWTSAWSLSLIHI